MNKKRQLEKHLRSMEWALATVKRQNSEKRYYGIPYKTGYFENQIESTKKLISQIPSSTGE